VGSYSFSAHYSGDITYSSVDGPCEPLQVTQISATVITEIHNAAHAPVTNVPAGTSVHDKAIVAGTFGVPTGSVTFTFFSNSGCTGQGTPTGTITVDATGAAHPSDSTAALTPGGYSFRARYNGNINYTAGDSNCEPLSVGQVAPTVITDIHNAAHAPVTNVPAGTSVHDKATVSGSFGVPTGTVSFTFFTDSACAGQGTPMGTIAVDATGAAHPSDSTTPPTPGGYGFRARYNGDVNYTATNSSCEPLSVGLAPATVVTEIHNAAHTAVLSVPAGTSVHDKATVSGSFGVPSGTVAFTFFTNNTCTGQGTPMGTIALDATGAAHPSISTAALSAGGYSFSAHYNGNITYGMADSLCEPLAVGQLTPTIVTVIHDPAHTPVASVPAGTSVHDQATVSGIFGVPTGMVSFTFFSNNTCASTGASAGTIAVDGTGVAHPSSGTTALSAGGYSFRAHYNGDTNYTAADSACEPLEVRQLTPAVVTEIHDANHAPVTTVSAGTSVHDKATVSGGFGVPTGTASFTFFASNTCSGPGTAMGTLSVDAVGVAHPSISTAQLSPGGYSFRAHYNGDTNYTIADSACEALVVSQLAPTVVTEIHNDAHAPVVSVPAGASVHDKATVSGAFGVPTGTVTFTFFTNNTCAGQGAAMGTISLDGTGVAHPSSSPVPLVPGGYSFRAHYDGNTTYTAADSPCEPLSVGQVAAVVVTEIHDAGHHPVTSVLAGSIVHDKATVSGGFGTPTGAVTFSFFNNSTCTGQGANAGTIALASGAAHPSNSTAPLAAGGYGFRARYNGDATYAAADSACESLAVGQLTPTVMTEIHDAAHHPVTSVPAGASVHDKATVSGSFGAATGNVSFTFFTNGACTGQGTGAGTIALASGVAHPSASQYVANTGSYSFRARYNGDANYAAASSACEPLTVTTGASAFMTGEGQVIGERNAKITFEGSARGTVGGRARGQFSIVNHRTGEMLKGKVTAVLNVDAIHHEMTFCFTTKSGAQYTVRWQDNGVRNNNEDNGGDNKQQDNGAGNKKRSSPDKLTLASGCAFPPVAILWGVNNADVVDGDIVWHGIDERDKNEDGQNGGSGGD
jgi:hypothetical protein